MHLSQHEGGPNAVLECSVDHMGAHMRWGAVFAGQVIRRATAQGLVVRAGDALSLTPLGRETAHRAMVR